MLMMRWRSEGGGLVGAGYELIMNEIFALIESGKFRFSVCH